jgi:hypothetical protein
MAAGKYDFTIEQGTTFLKTFVWKDSNGDPIVITDFTIRLKAKNQYADSAILIDLSTDGGGITIIDPAAGSFEAYMSATETAALDFSKGLYDLEMEDPDGEVTRLLEGKVTLSREVTDGSHSS